MAVYRERTTKWPYIANIVFQLYKNMVNKVTFLGFMGAIAQSPAPGASQIVPGKVKICFIYHTTINYER